MNTTYRIESNPVTQRWHALDAVRGLALLLGVVLHATMSYLPGSQHWWIVSDQNQSVALAVAFYVIHMFRMLAFFLIAGFFARLALERWGSRRFVIDRARRIAVPLLAGWAPIFAAIVAVVVWAAWIKGGGNLPTESPPGPAFTPDDFPLTHLWFLYVLLLLYVAALLLHGVSVVVDRGDRIGAGGDWLLRHLLRPWAAFALAVPLAWAMLHTSKWSPWFGIPTPDASLYPNLAATVGFGMAFALGWWIHRQANMLLAQIEQQCMFHLLVAATATVACLSMLGLTPAYLPAQGEAERLLYAICYCVAGWSWTLAVIGIALRHLSGYSASRRYVADASYWIYLVHLPILMALQVVGAQLNFPCWVEYPLQVILAMGVMLLSYRYLVRNTWVGATLNGRRYPPADRRLTALPEGSA